MKTKNTLTLMSLVLLTCAVSINVFAENAPLELVVEMPDEALAAAVRKALRLAPDAPITRQALQRLGYLSAPTHIGIKDLTGLEHATRLRSLSLDFQEIHDLRPLSGLTLLRHLDIDNNQISDVTPLKDLTLLETLELGNNQIRDVTPLKDLTLLETLYLYNNQIRDVTPLKDLTLLRWLSLYGNQISDVTPLKDLTLLETLYLSDNQISDVTPLSGLTLLEDLSLYINQISDVTPLKDLTLLRWLRLYNNQISDVTPLKDLTLLETLELYYNQISDVTPLSGLTLLRSLYLDNNQIIDVTPLKDLTQLRHLDLDNNQIIDVTPLKDLTQLWTLDLDNNQIRDVTPIQHLIDSKSVRRVRLDGNPIGEPPEVEITVLPDLTGDGSIDENDFLIVVAQFGLDSAPATTGKIKDITNPIVEEIYTAYEASGVISDVSIAVKTHADLNNDGTVDFADIKFMAEALADAGVFAAPNVAHLTPDTVEQWIMEARQMWESDPASFHGIAVLEQFQTRLPPLATALLSNYPNPFNPETWIPYHLAKPADVTLTIYDVNGRIVRTLDVGHQRAGRYQDRARAAYWDGRNTHREPVASGVYFYMLSAGDFTATRRMLIRK